MDFLQLAKSRYAVRKYSGKKVEQEKLQIVLEAGRIAPTAANLQPQRLIVVQEKEGIERVKKAANIYDAPLIIIICSDRDAAWKRKIDGKNSGDIDASIVTDHMMLQATELGLGSLWICQFKPDVLREEFNIPANMEPVNILAIGYADGQPASTDRFKTTRKKMEETVFYEML